MPARITSPAIRIPLEPLTPAAFAQFGTVVENPTSSGHTNPNAPLSITANQGSAVKYLDVTQITNHYPQAPSKKLAKPVMNMFSCAPRKLRRLVSRKPAAATLDAEQSIQLPAADAQRTMEDRPNIQLFDVSVLERHPYTPQTFIPLGLSPSDATTAYLVIVAPTRPMSKPRTKTALNAYPPPGPKPRRSLSEVFARARPSPFTNVHAPSRSPGSLSAEASNPSSKPKGFGKPEIAQARAFLARGNQAVTYGVGTWHAPMVVLGDRSVDFVVVQYANGVAQEDCQEILVQRKKGQDEGLVVEVNDDAVGRIEKGMSVEIDDLTTIRAKL